MSHQPDLSVIIPFYNEEENITRMHAAVVGALEPLGLRFEMVFVDDGSRDHTLERAIALARTDARLRVVKFRRNYGQTPAMAAGIEQALGKVLITMDGDLQNDPTDIPRFLEKIDEGFDIVVGWRHDRQDKLISRKIPSMIANWIIGKVTGVPIKDNGCSLKAFRASLIKQIPLYSEMHRFIPAMASIAGPRVSEIKVKHHARQFGKSKYGISRVYKVLLDLMVIKTIASFAARPLQWFSVIAAPLLIVGTVAVVSSYLGLDGVRDSIAIPVAGVGIILMTAAAILVMGGAIGELVYKLGDVRDFRLALLTQVLTPQHGRGENPRSKSGD